MSLIRTILIAGASAYIVIALIQALENQAVGFQAAAAVLLLAFAGAITLVRNEIALKKGEMALVWGCILLFCAYALIRAGGLLW